MDKILIVEDEPLIREELALLLSNAGYCAVCAADFGRVPDEVRAACPDLILLDVTLPGPDGYALCSRIRSFTATPILFLTGRSTAMDELQALTLGGDDYIAKPYNIPVLLARIRLLLKRGKPGNGSPILSCQGIRLDPVAGTIQRDGRTLALTKTELKLLCRFFAHPGEILSRLDLVEYLWDNAIHIDDNTLSVNIMRLREKLGALGAPDLIQTRRGMGYQL